jgi:hypothetical protein
MIIIYVGYQNFPLAALAACIRVGSLPGDRLPEMKELLKLPFITELIRPKTPASVGGGFQRAVKSSMDSANIQRGLNPPLNEVSFNKDRHNAWGKLTYMGNDSENNRVYAVWARGGQVLNGTISSFMKIFDVPGESCSIIQVLGPEPYLLGLGLSMSKLSFLSGLAATIAERQLQTLYPPLSGLARVLPGQLDCAW